MNANTEIPALTWHARIALQMQAETEGLTGVRLLRALYREGLTKGEAFHAAYVASFYYCVCD